MGFNNLKRIDYAFANKRKSKLEDNLPLPSAAKHTVTWFVSLPVLFFHKVCIWFPNLDHCEEDVNTSYAQMPLFFGLLFSTPGL